MDLRPTSVTVSRSDDLFIGFYEARVLNAENVVLVQLGPAETPAEAVGLARAWLLAHDAIDACADCAGVCLACGEPLREHSAGAKGACDKRTAEAIVEVFKLRFGGASVDFEV